MFELKERQRRIEEEEEAARQIALEEERQRQREREERERQEAEAAREREERRSATEELRQSTGKEREFGMGGGVSLLDDEHEMDGHIEGRKDISFQKKSVVWMEIPYVYGPCFQSHNCTHLNTVHPYLKWRLWSAQRAGIRVVDDDSRYFGDLVASKSSFDPFDSLFPFDDARERIGHQKEGVFFEIDAHLCQEKASLGVQEFG